MKIEFTVPDGFHIMSMQSTPTKDGSLSWNVYVRKNGNLQFHGAQGFDLQATVNKAHEGLLKKLSSTPKPRLADITINIEALRRKL